MPILRWVVFLVMESYKNLTVLLNSRVGLSRMQLGTSSTLFIPSHYFLHQVCG